MISNTLQTLTATTEGDVTKSEAKIIEGGVTQGGPASSTLFNIFIDSHANELQKHLWNQESELPTHLYADYVIIHLKSILDLQRALIICERWALKCGMRWALSKGKSEVIFPQNLSCNTKHSRSQAARSQLLLKCSISEWYCRQMEYWNAASRAEYRCYTLR